MLVRIWNSRLFFLIRSGNLPRFSAARKARVLPEKRLAKTRSSEPARSGARRRLRARARVVDETAGERGRRWAKVEDKVARHDSRCAKIEISQAKVRSCRCIDSRSVERDAAARLCPASRFVHAEREGERHARGGEACAGGRGRTDTADPASTESLLPSPVFP